MNIFEQAVDFIELDNRKDREVSRVTAESTYNRYSAQLPEWLVKGKSVLDLGSCLASAGHWVLTQGASSYVGVEVQDYYVTTSNQLMSKYWPNSAWSIIQQDIEQFLDLAIKEKAQWDIVVASGVLYGFFNTFSILEKISQVAREVVTIDTIRPSADDLKFGLIVMMPQLPINSSTGTSSYYGLSSNVNLKGLDLIMNTNGFVRKEDVILPPKTLNSHDSYHDIIEYPGGSGRGVARYMTRYYRVEHKLETLQEKVVSQDASALMPNAVRPVVEERKHIEWKFDSAVAERFQQEARDHIPDYARVVDLCLDIANRTIARHDTVIDVGSALGYTMDKFIKEQYLNVYGVESSREMIDKTSNARRVFYSNQFPDARFKFVMINWTLHFVTDKIGYLKDVYRQMLPGSTLILTDKTTQSEAVKQLYYDFKRANGVSEQYIKEKELKLKGYMQTMPASWYVYNIEQLGFVNLEIVNSRLGFVTFKCHKL